MNPRMAQHFNLLEKQKAEIERLSEGVLRQAEEMNLIDIALDAVFYDKRDELKDTIRTLYESNIEELSDEFSAVMDDAEVTAFACILELRDADNR